MTVRRAARGLVGRGVRGHSSWVAAITRSAQRWPAMSRPERFFPSALALRRAGRVTLVLLGLATIAAPGCVLVPRYAREHLSDPAMDPTADAIGSRELRKLHWAREGAAGGDGAPAGGGCGCGT